jgi:hypothetical protein
VGDTAIALLLECFIDLSAQKKYAFLFPVSQDSTSIGKRIP